jgi:predicted aminopeptidase
MIFNAYKILLIVMLAMVALCLASGCNTVGYYAQSIQGHLSLMGQRESIQDLLNHKNLDKKHRHQLETALSIRQYASEHLHLPENGSYSSYVKLDQPYIVWNVFATPELSMQPHHWCFPIVGCVAYRGYYSEKKAAHFAASLKDQGLDVFVGGSPAYSTLGWFDDPILSSMMNRGNILLAELIFHELSHQVLYFKNDVAFNEAFADSVGEFGVYQWLSDTQPEALSRYKIWLTRKDEFLQLIHQTTSQLRTLYSSNLENHDKRIQKKEIIQSLRDQYSDLKTQWKGFSGYDKWFESPINNARLASIAVYRDRVPDFNRWINACDGDLERYYASMKTLKNFDASERHQRLRNIAKCTP